MPNFIKLKENKFFKIILIPCYFAIVVLFSTLSRKYKTTTSSFPIEIGIINSFFIFMLSKTIHFVKCKERINLFTFLFLRKHPKKRDNYSFFAVLLCMALYFVFEFIYRTNFHKISSLSVCIFSQTRLITAFVFSTLVLRQKFTFFQFFGMILILTSIVLGSIRDENKTFCITTALKISFAASLNGLSACLFDLLLKEKVTDFLFYLGDSNFANLILSFFVQIFFCVKNKTPFLVFTSEIFLLSFLTSLVAIVVVVNSFCFNLIERIFLGFFASILRDFIADLVSKNKNGALKVFSYSLCLLGGLVFKGNAIASFFKKMKK